MNVLQNLESLLKEKSPTGGLVGLTLPEIRFWDGPNQYSDMFGNYRSDTLEGSLNLFIKINRNMLYGKIGPVSIK